MGRLDRAGRVTLLVAACLVGAAAAFVWLRVTGPSDGARLKSPSSVWRPDGVLVSVLQEQENGLRDGDIVVAVGGRRVEAWARSLLDRTVPRPAWRVGDAVAYTVRDAEGLRDVSVVLGPYPLLTILAREWGTMVFAVAFAALAGFVFLRRPALPAARTLFLLAAALLAATTWSLGLQIGDLVFAQGFWLYLATTVGGYLLIYAAAVHLLLIFPRPRPRVERHRGVVPALYALPYLFVAGHAWLVRRGSAGTLDWIGRAETGVGWVELIYMLLIVGAAITGVRGARDPVSRRQIRWIALASALAASAGLAFGALPQLLLGQPLISWNAVALVGLLIPVALAAAILQHRLFDIEVIVNRTFVYGVLTAIVVGIYLLVVGYLGKVFQTWEGLPASLVATGIVAVLFHPLRERLQRAVNRWMYGERDDPYAVIAQLGRRLESAVTPEAVLPTIVETIAQTMKLPYAAITLQQRGRTVTAVSYGLPRGEPVAFPLTYQGEAVGQLILSPRAAGETFTLPELHLMEDLAPQAGVAVHTVRLTADLRRSREELITAREEERRRLRRDLHDGLGPALAGLTLKLEAARNHLGRDAAAAAALLEELKAEAQAAVADIRRLVYNLRPAALDDLGLCLAIREQIAHYQTNGLRITLEAPDHLPPLPAAVEVAAYRIVLEALTNVLRHAAARTCRITIALNETLNVEITDDGRGIPPAQRAGIGLASMRERAEELGGSCVVEPLPGGGTRVLTRLPLRRP